MGGAECILHAILIKISQVAMFLQCRKTISFRGWNLWCPDIVPFISKKKDSVRTAEPEMIDAECILLAILIEINLVAMLVQC
jgi:hypothetical protein